MRKWLFALVATLAAVFLMSWGPGCSSNNPAEPGAGSGGEAGTDAGTDADADASTDAGGAGGDSSVATTALRGKVTAVNGAAIGGVKVNLGDATATSFADGSFAIDAEPGPGQMVSLDKAGYVASAWRVDIDAGTEAYLPVTMMPMAAAQPLDAVQGGSVAGARGARLDAPPGAFVDPGGAPVTGQVQVSLTPYDPAIAAQALAYPGELRGLTRDGELVPLRTYGLLDVTVTQSGAVLSVAPGQSLQVRVPAASAGERPSSMRLWHFDSEQALWVEESAAGNYDAGSNTYSAVLGPGSKLDYVENADNPFRPSCVHGLVVDDQGKPVSGARITAQSADDDDTRGVYSAMQTGLNGAFCMTLEMDQKALLRVTTPDGTVTERSITAGTAHSNDYPADCSGSNCLQVATIVTGEADPGEATEADCDVDVFANPFALTCAASLGDFYACFAPAGACHSKIDFAGMGGASYEVSFDNGARIESGFDPLYLYPVTKYYGPGGTYCGLSEFDGTAVSIKPEGGGTFRVETEADGSMTVVCDSASFTMSAAQMDAMAACTGHAGDVGDGVACEPVAGSFTASCLFDTDCDTGLDCCGPASTMKKQCLFVGMCAAACGSNADCGVLDHHYVCCSNSLFDSCMLPADCQ